MSRDFFNLVLPDVGLRCIASSGRRFAPTFYSDNGSAASAAATLDVSGQGEIYFGCASYFDPAKGRKGHNVRVARSFWLDFDTDELKGNGQAPYAGRSAALVALERLCFRLALSASAVVSSGYGLHVYWALDSDLPPDEWRETAKLLKRVCDTIGVEVDHSRTTDIASVLRVPGTHNRKDPGNPKQVIVLSLGDPIEHENFRGRLIACLDDLTVARLPAALGAENNINIASTVDHWFDRLSPDDKNACLAEMLKVTAVIALADTSDKAPSPNWRTVVAACVRSGAPDAYCLCRAWAQTSERFDPDNFDVRWRSYARG